MEAIFTNIYTRKLWKTFPWDPLSGSGSKLSTTEPYRNFLIEFIRRNSVKSVVDFGCGDWTFSSYIPWQSLEVQYLGIDVYAPLLQQNAEKYGSPNIHFMHADLTLSSNPLPYADVWIIKDVFQHWPNAQIRSFLQQMTEARCFKFVLLTNSSTEGKNRDIALGSFRPLNPQEDPLVSFSPHILLTFGGKNTSILSAPGANWNFPYYCEAKTTS